MRTTEKTRTFTCNDCRTSGSSQWMETHPCGHNQYVAESGGRCEDYPACGHTDGDGCYALESHTSEYWAKSPHLMCDHEAGVCDAYEDEVDDEPDEEHDHYDACEMSTEGVWSCSRCGVTLLGFFPQEGDYLYVGVND